jgi:hypothetical protein
VVVVFVSSTGNPLKYVSNQLVVVDKKMANAAGLSSSTPGNATRTVSTTVVVRVTVGDAVSTIGAEDGALDAGARDGVRVGVSEAVVVGEAEITGGVGATDGTLDGTGVAGATVEGASDEGIPVVGISLGTSEGASEATRRTVGAVVGAAVPTVLVGTNDGSSDDIAGVNVGGKVVVPFEATGAAVGVAVLLATTIGAGVVGIPVANGAGVAVGATGAGVVADTLVDGEAVVTAGEEKVGNDVRAKLVGSDVCCC